MALMSGSCGMLVCNLGSRLNEDANPFVKYYKLRLVTANTATDMVTKTIQVSSTK